MNADETRSAEPERADRRPDEGRVESPRLQKIAHYEILKRLGKGGMGEVFLAVDPRLDRKVALKFLPDALQRDQNALQRFLREAKAAASLDHPFICKIYDAGEADGRAFIAMEYVEGVTLEERVERPLEQTLRISREICDALDFAHQRGIVHRDLKPANIMLTPQGHPKIMDFGLAKRVGVVDDDAGAPPTPSSGRESDRSIADDETLIDGVPAAASMAEDETVVGVTNDADGAAVLGGPAAFGVGDTEAAFLRAEVGKTSSSGGDSSTVIGTLNTSADSNLTQVGTLLGTPAYMSPEQARGGEVDARTDIFSFGVMLYEMLTGVSPFKRGSVVATIKALMKEPAPPMELGGGKVADRLQPIVDKALRKDADDRYERISELSQALRDVRRDLVAPKRKAWQVALVSVATTAVIAVAAWLGLRPGIVVEPEPVRVLVADFENRTHETAFDGAVEQAMTVGLEGASFVNAFRRGRARRIAEQIRPGVNGLDAELARLIAGREAIGAIVTGSIEARGQGFRVEVSTIDGLTGEVIDTSREDARSRDGVLQAIARLSGDVRRALGDAELDRSSVAEETFTAATLVAAQSYARGQELMAAGRWEESLEHYRQAIDEDPEFGRAYAGMASALANLGRLEEAKAQYQAALARIDRMSDREKYRTRGGYYLMERKHERAAAEFESLIGQFPTDESGLSNLPLAYFYSREMHKAVETGRRAVEAYPGNLLSRANLSLYALYAGEFPEAIAEADEVLKLNAGYELAHVARALSQIASDDFAAARASYEALLPLSTFGESMATIGLADLALMRGRPSDAVGLLEPSIAQDVSAGRNGLAARKRVLLAQAHAALGDASAAVIQAQTAMAESSALSVGVACALLLMDAGRPEPALAFAGDLVERLDVEPQVYGLLIQGRHALQQEKWRTAVRLLTEANQQLDTWLGHLFLGQAYLGAGEFTEAYSEFEVATRREGEAAAIFLDDIPSYRYFPDALYGLGRAQDGLSSPAAADSYRAFLTLKDGEEAVADPLVTAARSRLVALE